MEQQKCPTTQLTLVLRDTIARILLLYHALQELTIQLLVLAIPLIAIQYQLVILQPPKLHHLTKNIYAKQGFTVQQALQMAQLTLVQMALLEIFLVAVKNRIVAHAHQVTIVLIRQWLHSFAPLATIALKEQFYQFPALLATLEHLQVLESHLIVQNVTQEDTVQNKGFPNQMAFVTQDTTVSKQLSHQHPLMELREMFALQEVTVNLGLRFHQTAFLDNTIPSPESLQ